MKYLVFFTNAQEQFNKNMTTTFKAVDKLMADDLGMGNYLHILDIQPNIKQALLNIKGATGKSFDDARAALTNAKSLVDQPGNKASFVQLYNARKSINDEIMSGDATVGRVLKPVLDDIDRSLSRERLDVITAGAKLTTEQVKTIGKAQNQLLKARKRFQRR